MHMPTRFSAIGQKLILFVLFLGLSGCSCCLYFNHYYNVKKYYRRGYNMLEARRDTLPDDTMWSAENEKQNWDKVVHTGSLILDRWTDDRSYKADVLLRMGDAYFYSGKWPEAITKYDEYERYFPEHEQIPRAEYHRIWALHKMGENSMAAFQAKELLTNRPDHAFKEQIQELYALTFTAGSQSDKAIEILEKLLNTPGQSGLLRARVRLQLADLYFQKESFAQALPHYQDSSTQFLSLQKQHYSLRQGALCLFNLGQVDAAIQAISPLSLTPYEEFAVDSKIEEGRYRLNSKDPAKGMFLLDSVAQKLDKTLPASYAYWMMGDYLENKLEKYPEAIEEYQQATIAFVAGEYGRLSRYRIAALNKFLSIQKKATGDKTPEEQFQYAELFLFDMKKADSSLSIIENLISSSSEDSLTQLKAKYTKAFLLSEYLNRPEEANAIYHELVQNHPGSEFALQAQINLGEEVTIQTIVNRAQKEFTAAESSYYALDTIALVDSLAYDSLLQIALANFDTLSQSFQGTAYAPKALYLKAWILEFEQRDLPKARATYKRIAEDYPESAYGKKSQEKVVAVLDEDHSSVEREKQILEDLQKNHQKRQERRIRNQEREELQKKPTEEELLWDYNHLYDF